MSKKRKFSKVAYSSVCILALLTNTAQSFTMQDYFGAAAKGDYEQMRSFIEESRQAMVASGGAYDLNLDIRDVDGNTAAMTAAQNGQLTVLSYLVNYGANLELKNNSGQTAYSLAMQNGHMAVAEYILNTFQQQSEMALTNTAMPEYPPLTLPEAPQPLPVEAHSATGLGLSGPILVTAGLAAVIGGVVAIAAGGGGGGGSGGGNLSTNPNNDPIQLDFPDTGGATGAGDIHPNADVPATFLTAETADQEGYETMNTHEAAARGYDGSVYRRDPVTGLLINDTADGFIKVAVVDTGVDLTHADIDGNILTANAVTCTVGGGCVAGGDDPLVGGGHGTIVAGIIAAEKDGVGIQGIAPAAKIMPIAFLAETNGSDMSALQYAIANNANIINASYGLEIAGQEIPIITKTQGTGSAAFSPADMRTLVTQDENGTDYETVFTNMVNSHSVIVWAAGNAGMDQPGVLAGLPYYFQGTNPGITGYATVNPNALDFSQNWLTVVSVQNDVDHTISTFSNYCGVAKNWCLAAPGEITSVLQNGGGYDNGGSQGTSFAAPNVSAALAVLMGAFPHLTARQLTEILLDTATDLNINPNTGVADAALNGVDEIYGHGLVDLEAATSPTSGGWNIVTGPSSFSHGFTVQNSSLRLSPSFGDGLAGLSEKRLMFLDKYNRDFGISLGSLIQMNSAKQDPLDTMQRFGNSNMPQMADAGIVKVGYSAYTNSDTGSAEMRKYAGEQVVDKVMLTSDIPVLGSVMRTSFAKGVDVSEMETLGSKTSLAENSLSGSFRNQFMGLSQNAQNFSVQNGNENLGVKMGYYYSDGKTDEFDTQDNASMKGFYSTVNYKPSSNGSFYVQTGMNVEDGSFLGSRSEGALSIGPETKTYFTTFAYEHAFTGNLAFLGSYSVGMTEMGVSENSLIKNISNASVDSFALGLEYSNVFAEEGGDKFGLAFSQPLRVRNANANVMLPMDIMGDGSIVYDSFSTSIAPGGRELDLEGYYTRPFGEDSTLKLGTVLRSQPDNIKDAGTEALFVTKFGTKF